MASKNLHVASHPVVAQKMTYLRDVKTSSQDFRRLLREITFYLGYEATKNLTTVPKTITTPMHVQCEGAHVSQKIALIPILRAGLSMSDAMLELLPTATVHHIGMYRSKASSLPVQYYNRLPRNEQCDVAYILDPCIATASTLHAVVSIVQQWGAKKVVIISALGSKFGVEKIIAGHPDVEIFCGALDNELNESGMIIPGLGDAGDRQFKTPDIPDPTVLAPFIEMEDAANKRARTEK